MFLLKEYEANSINEIVIKYLSTHPVSPSNGWVKFELNIINHCKSKKDSEQ